MEHLRAEPLRDKHHPLGLPDLHPNDAARVYAANQLYFVTLCVAFVAARRNSLLSVENPSNAYFWQNVFLGWALHGLNVSQRIFRLVSMEGCETNGHVGMETKTFFRA